MQSEFEKLHQEIVENVKGFRFANFWRIVQSYELKRFVKSIKLEKHQ